MQLAVISAGLLAMAGALFGAIGARVFWAEDLHHAQQLRKIWNETEKALQETIAFQERELSAMRERARTSP